MPDNKPRPKYNKTLAPVLTVNDVRFCQAIVEGCTQYEAYIKAKYPVAKRQTRSAQEKMASLLIRKGKIREYIRELQNNAAEAAKVTVEELAADTRAVSRADIRKLYDEDGVIRPVHEWPDELAKAIEGVENDEETGLPIKVKLASKSQARRMLGEWLRMFGEEAALVEMMTHIKELRARLEAVKDGKTPSGDGQEGA